MRNDTLTLRPATLRDSDNLFQWRNDPVTRNASHNTAEIKKEEHISWLTKTLDDPSKYLLIAEQNGSSVGTVRADLCDGVYELSWTVAFEARGCGVGKRMVALATEQFTGPIRSEIKKGNNPSVKIAKHAGMMFEREENGILHYRRDAQCKT